MATDSNTLLSIMYAPLVCQERQDMRKKEVDRLVKKLLEDKKNYTQMEIRQMLNDNIGTEQLIRVYRRYLYLKNKNIL